MRTFQYYNDSLFFLFLQAFYFPFAKFLLFLQTFHLFDKQKTANFLAVFLIQRIHTYFVLRFSPKIFSNTYTPIKRSVTPTKMRYICHISTVLPKN